MRVLFAPDSFKGCLSALEVAEAMALGFCEGFPSTTPTILPMADGGEGTMQALIDATKGELVPCQVRGPLGDPIAAHYGILGDKKTAVIEMAQAAGYMLMPSDNRRPLDASTYGVGELISEALARGLRRFIIALGGSATIDGGVGAMAALGASFLDATGNKVSPCGRFLNAIDSIDVGGLDSRLHESSFLLACDVANTLLGADGAAAVYGPQKGASADEVILLTDGLAALARALERAGGRGVTTAPGIGAGGGMGLPFAALFGAEICPGVTLVADIVDCDRYCQEAALVVTGEGELNYQSAYGKTPVGVARIAKAHGVPTIAIAGSLGKGYESLYAEGISAMFSLTPGPISLEESLQRAQERLRAISRQIATILTIGRALS